MRFKYNPRRIWSVEIMLRINNTVQISVNGVVVYDGRSLKIASQIRDKYTNLMIKQLDQDNLNAAITKSITRAAKRWEK